MKKRADKKNKFSLKEQYSQSWNYIRSSRNFIYSVIILFFVFALIGFFVPAPEEFSKIILEYLKEILGETEGLSQVGLIKFIFLNNIQSSFAGMIFGFLFGIFPLIATVFNGYVVGFVSSIAVEQGGIITLLDLLPHGIFELPAIFISLGLGLKFGTFLFQKNIKKSFNNFFIESMRVFVFVILPLLIIAAVIEGSLIALNW
jgi:stage II sporulation protein M